MLNISVRGAERHIRLFFFTELLHQFIFVFSSRKKKRKKDELCKSSVKRSFFCKSVKEEKSNCYKNYDLVSNTDGFRIPLREVVYLEMRWKLQKWAKFTSKVIFGILCVPVYHFILIVHPMLNKDKMIHGGGRGGIRVIFSNAVLLNNYE